MMNQSDSRIRFLVSGLLALPFLTKISLSGFYIPVPSQFSYLIFQHGMHPYINIIFSLVFGLPLVFLSQKIVEPHSLSPYYVKFLRISSGVLAFQTICQALFVNTDQSFFLQMTAMALSLFMIYVYGYTIPRVYPIGDFVEMLKKWCLTTVVLSFFILLINKSAAFNGGRFIGVFKNIPYMVTACTTGFIFYVLPFKSTEKLNFFIRQGILLLFFVGIILTGTRSSAVAAVVSYVFQFFLFKPSKNSEKVYKASVVILVTGFFLMFGFDLFDYGLGVMKGEKQLGLRQAQDGFSSRMDEVKRGLDIFQMHPWTGVGIVSKFTAGSELDVNNYNSFKDPHNLFVSAGVIGGWPLMLVSVFGVCFLVVAFLKGLKSKENAQKIVAIYVGTHIPILIVYHLHLSMGGLADRIYWLVFGYLSLLL